MITMNPMNAAKMLGAKLARLYDPAQITLMLGITQEQPEKFWEAQKMTVVARFYEFLLHREGLPLTTDRATLPEEKIAYLGLVAGHLMNGGLTYTDVRDWWLMEGKYLHEKQFAAKRELERLNSACIKVMFLFEDSKPKFLSYATVVDIETDPLGALNVFDAQTAPRAQRQAILVDEASAHEFPVYSVSELDKDSLAEQAKSFEALSRILGATGVKLLVKRKSAVEPVAAIASEAAEMADAT